MVSKQTHASIVRWGTAAGRLGLLTLAFWMAACVTGNQASQGDPTDQIMAINSQMKKRLVLIERENDVLEQENLQYKAIRQQLEATIEKLNADLKVLHEKYEVDMALSEEQLNLLLAKFELYEAESIQTITELNQLYEALQAKRNQELKSHNEKITDQQTRFNQERDQLKRAYAAMELDLSSQVNELKKSLSERDAEIIRLNATVKEISQALEQTRKDLDFEKNANLEMFEKLKTLLNERGSKKGNDPPNPTDRK